MSYFNLRDDASFSMQNETRWLPVMYCVSNKTLHLSYVSAHVLHKSYEIFPFTYEITITGFFWKIAAIADETLRWKKWPQTKNKKLCKIATYHKTVFLRVPNYHSHKRDGPAQAIRILVHTSMMQLLRCPATHLKMSPNYALAIQENCTVGL